MKKVNQKNAKLNTNRIKKIRSKRNIISGCVYIKATFNNTIISISDGLGNVLSWATSGGSGYRGSRKSTPFAAQSVAEKVASLAFDAGMRKAEVVICGPGNGRDTAIRALQGCGLEILLIKDITPVPHNGCRPPKRRRV